MVGIENLPGAGVNEPMPAAMITRREITASPSCRLSWKPLGWRLDAFNFPSVEVRYSLTLVPQTILDELIERHRSGKVCAAGCLVRF